MFKCCTQDILYVVLTIQKEIIMSIEDRIDATVKNVEGKVQEAVGEVTGNPKDKTEGKEKQTEAQVQHSVENVKDDLKKTID